MKQIIVDGKSGDSPLENKEESNAEIDEMISEVDNQDKELEFDYESATAKFEKNRMAKLLGINN